MVSTPNAALFKDLFIEVSGLCNAKCPWCPTGSTPMPERSHEFMTPDLFKKILERVSNEAMVSQRCIHFYNWGEPFLNPYLSELCEIAGQYNYKVGLSTNASKYVELSDKAIKNIDYVTFSVSGMTQSSYGRIHGFEVMTVLKNIQKYCDIFSQINKSLHRGMSFHVYKFNHGDIGKARTFCAVNSINFVPYYANFGIIELNISFLKDEFTRQDKTRQDKTRQDKNTLIERREQEIETFYVKDLLAKQPENYKCPQFEKLVIDETGQLLTCCGVSRGHEDYSLGSFMDMSLQEILELKRGRKICIECMGTGSVYWGHNPMLYKYK